MRQPAEPKEHDRLGGGHAILHLIADPIRHALGEGSFSARDGFELLLVAIPERDVTGFLGEVWSDLSVWMDEAAAGDSHESLGASDGETAHQ